MNSSYYLLVFFVSVCFQNICGAAVPFDSPTCSEFYQNRNGRYYQYPQGVMFFDYSERQCFFQESSFKNLNFPSCERESNFFSYILSESSFGSFAQSLITFVAEDHGLKLLFESSPLQGQFLSEINRFDLQEDMLVYLFCNPLRDNNLIQLSYLLHKNLQFSPGKIDKICILSLVLFAGVERFNAINSLKWAIKKGLYFDVQKILLAGIHPNWVLDSQGMTGLQIALVNRDKIMANFILSISGVDRNTPNFFNHTALDLAQKYNL